ncbi:MAG: type IV-A pilus assembly ATPase PilB [Deltaproteobacteria bacterium]|nr:type IV-A pilus assembly ATPase PilB [Deltaproteobacteria bacterium]
MPARLGELLVRENLISLQQLQKAQTSQKQEGGKLGYHLTKLGFIEESELTQFLSKQYGVPAINLADFEIESDVIALIPKDVAQKHQIIPVNRAGASLIVAMSDPSNIFAIDDIKFLTGYNIEVVVASEAAIAESWEKYYNSSSGGGGGGDLMADISLEDIVDEFNDEDIDVAEQEDNSNVLDLGKAAEDAPVVKLVNLILVDAIKKGASDIHIEPYEKEFRVRYRVDGVLHEVMKPPLKLRNAISSRLKIMAELDIAERRLPQDGRIKLRIGKGREMDYRVSVCPTLFGEKIVMRLLDSSNLQLDMTKLGLSPSEITIWTEAIKKPFGMCLVTGPTGSGKTTTLYSALAALNTSDVNISTAEDPVEFNFAGINQVQQHEDIGLNFAATLRSFLRQDPDIIMVGEIRDFETAEIAVKASLTGHMVLSTLHTNDAPATVTRLLNMGIEPFLVTAAVNVIIAQRLGRRICGDCKAPFELENQAMIDAEINPQLIGTFQPMKGTGCDTCGGSGYRGRVAFYEVLKMMDELRELVLNGAATNEIRDEAIKLGFITLRQSSLRHFTEGTTTIDEVVRSTAPDKN